MKRADHQTNASLHAHCFQISVLPCFRYLSPAHQRVGTCLVFDRVAFPQLHNQIPKSQFYNHHLILFYFLRYAAYYTSRTF